MDPLGRQNFGFLQSFPHIWKVFDSFSTEVLAFAGSNFGEAVQSQLGMPDLFVCSGKIRRYRAVIREKAGFFRCELKEWKINLSNIVIYDGFMMKPWESRRQKNIVAMSIMNHEQEQRPKYITMIIRWWFS